MKNVLAKLTGTSAVAYLVLVPSAVLSGPSEPHSQSEEPYSYPLLPGTAAWKNATVTERLQSVQIPQSWRDHATSWQLFRSAIAHPYFRSICFSGGNMERAYSSAKIGTVSILGKIDTAPDFGTNVLRWLAGLDLLKMASSECSESREPCWMDYRIVCYMASLNSALETIDLGSRQKLFRLAVWDADYFLSRNDDTLASGPVEIVYAIYQKPESFRGALPGGLVLPPIPAGGSTALDSDRPRFLRPRPVDLHSALAAAKVALGLTQRPLEATGSHLNN
jgi:hypothetical protein